MYYIDSISCIQMTTLVMTSRHTDDLHKRVKNGPNLGFSGFRRVSYCSYACSPILVQYWRTGGHKKRPTHNKSDKSRLCHRFRHRPLPLPATSTRARSRMLVDTNIFTYSKWG